MCGVLSFEVRGWSSVILRNFNPVRPVVNCTGSGRVIYQIKGNGEGNNVYMCISDHWSNWLSFVLLTTAGKILKKALYNHKEEV